MTTAVKRKRGAQPGNRNACKPDYYYHTLTPEEQQRFRKLSRAHGFEPEITGLRQALKSLLGKDTPDYRLIKQGYSTLVSLTRYQLRLDRDDSRRLGKTARDLMRDMSVLAGILSPSRSSKIISAGPDNQRKQR